MADQQPNDELAVRKTRADVEKAEAEARKAAAEADRDVAAARRSALQAMLPDFSKLKDNVLTPGSGPPLRSAVLANQALSTAAGGVAARVLKAIQQGADGEAKAPPRLLLTADGDLATRDTTFRDVDYGFTELMKAVATVQPAGAWGSRDRSGPRTMGVPMPGAIAEAAAVVAGAIPGVLTLLSSQGTLSSAPVSIADQSAIAAVAGALLAPPSPPYVIEDDARLVPTDGPYQAFAELGTELQRLRALHLAMSARRVDQVDLLATKQAEASRLGLAAETAAPTDKPGLQRLLEVASAAVAEQSRASREIDLLLGQVESIETAIEAFLTAIRQVPPGGRRSALATAALCQALHSGTAGKPGITHVLIVKGQPGVAEQVLEKRALWFRGRFTTFVDVSLSYLLVETASSRVVAAGIETATVKAYGKIGELPIIT